MASRDHIRFYLCDAEADCPRALGQTPRSCSVRQEANGVISTEHLRERLGITSAKKGCDHGQCGACTIMLDGRRALSCLALAVAHEGAEIITAARLGDSEDLHPLPARLHRARLTDVPKGPAGRRLRRSR